MEEDAVEGEALINQDPRFLKPDLYEAAKVNDTDTVLKLLGDQVPPTFIDNNNGWTALHWAAINGNILLLKKLLECGASAPYHRMLKQAKIKENESIMNSIILSEGKKVVDDVVQVLEEGMEGGSVDVNDGNEINEAKLSKKVSLLPTSSTADDDEADLEYFLETSVDLLNNTPLLWATVKGHLRAVWLLLLDGYSPNDKDHFGNNSLHLAAVNGHLSLLKVLIEDGGKSNIVNIYKNLPIDMATDQGIREVLSTAMEKGASMTSKDIALKHEQNMISYTMHVTALNTAMQEATKTESQLADMRTVNVPEVLRRVSDAINDAKEWALEEATISSAEKLLAKLEVTQDLLNDTNTLQRCLPVRSQTVYVQNVHKLERTICRAEMVNVDKSQVQVSLDLIKRCQIEYLLSTLINRLKDLSCARDPNEHDMNRLKQAVDKGLPLNASEDVVKEGDLLYKRLEAELGMSRAMLSVPVVKLPREDPPDGYWDECDTGKIEETELYPYPPAENSGEYKW
eukprot:CAMPEP_0119033840 /NCGR_PEP_ID=MMETSP1177-20130426/908_1 /TAXON_ID=2985 /ORGANISM="Ochromonas sp, Strain CCMP1899" /LENGTH=512 /DNA_ID=CAMNT_0006990903 /DNA_START=189 /DNA_END=1724 /DNA_ORIENTATION=-